LVRPTILSNLISLGFQGQVFPVHPKLDQVLGLKAYPDVNQIPLVADLAVIVVPTASVSKVLRECGQKGIRQAIIISGGFREAGQEGRRREHELIAIAQQYGIRFLGPNCIGVVNPRRTSIWPIASNTWKDASGRGSSASISKASSRPRNLCGLLGRFPGASRSLRCMWAVPRQAGGPGVLIRGRWPDRIGFMTASFGSAGDS
jgi:acyl-CoA synthetase (NDP forming)